MCGSNPICYTSILFPGKTERDNPVFHGNETDEGKKTEFHGPRSNTSFSHPVTFTTRKLKHKLFKCSQCGKKFVENIHLQQHVRDAHFTAQQTTSNPGFTMGQMKQKTEKIVSNPSSGQLQIKGTLPSQHLNQRNPGNSQGGNLEKVRKGGMQQAPQASGRNGSLNDSWNQGGRWIGASTGKLNTFQRSYRCTCCGKNFAKLRNLREHMFSHEITPNQSSSNGGGRSQTTSAV